MLFQLLRSGSPTNVARNNSRNR